MIAYSFRWKSVCPAIVSVKLPMIIPSAPVFGGIVVLPRLGRVDKRKSLTDE